MEVEVNIKGKTFQHLEDLLNGTMQSIKDAVEESAKIKDDRWLTTEEAAEYMGFERQYVLKRKEEIGCYHEGSTIRFKKSAVDAYMQGKHYLQRN